MPKNQKYSPNDYSFIINEAEMKKFLKCLKKLETIQLRSLSSEDGYQIEDKEAIKLQEIIREFQNKKMFYATHSRFATYIDEDYLDCFEKAMTTYSKNWIRLQDCTMGSTNIPGKETFGNTRQQHMVDCGKLSEENTRDLHLNSKFGRVIGMGHDFGHFTNGHAGERWINSYLQYYGICGVYHPTAARLVFYKESTHEKALKLLEQKKGRKLTSREKRTYYKNFLLIMDAIAVHNGEGTDTRIIANKEKKYSDIDEDFFKSFTNPDSTKKIKPKTVEGAVLRFTDPISYVAKDFRDGVLFLREKNLNDEEYEQIFRELGVPEHVLNANHSKKDILVQEVTEILRNDLINNSQGINGAKMSKAAMMYRLRKMNYLKSNIPRTKQIMPILEERVPILIDRYTEYLLHPEMQETAPDTNKIQSFIKTIEQKAPSILNETYRRIVKDGTEQSIRREIDAILNGDEEAQKTKRRKRLERDLKQIKNKDGSIDSEVLETYINRILREIQLSPARRDKQFEKYIRKQYPYLPDEEIAKKIEEESDLKLDTFSENLARIKAAMYIGHSSDKYLLEMLQSENLLTDEERKLAYIAGGTDNSVIDTMKSQEKGMSEIEKGER